MKHSLLLLVIPIFMLTSHSYAKIYKWKDASGQIHYTQTPPGKGLKSKQIIKTPASLPEEDNTITTPSSNQTANYLKKMLQTPSQNKDTPAKTLPFPAQLNNTQDSHLSPAPSPEIEQDKKINQYCDTQKKNLKSLQSHTMVNWKEGDSSTLLNPEQRLNKIQTIKDDIEFHC